jgi:branched-chain amino acid transport system ATP-binding protein
MVTDAFDGVEQQPGAPKRDTILSADGLVRRFGGITAVDVEHLEIQANAITGLIGPNGAGKTTFFNLITGFDEVTAGTFQFKGERLEGVPAYKVARKGLVRTFQLTKALSKLSVIDNMKLGAVGQTGENPFKALVRPIWSSQEREIEARADELLKRFTLHSKRDDYAGELSGGQRKLLEMARALMADPEVICLDEPMAGVNPALTQSLLQHVKELKDEGLTVIFVEHDMDVVRDISDWVVVMAEGSIIAEGTHASIGQNQDVIDAYLGTSHEIDLGTIELSPEDH